jgi:hypothetical protein
MVLSHNLLATIPGGMSERRVYTLDVAVGTGNQYGFS